MSKRCVTALLAFLVASAPVFAQTPEIEFFEAKIRPVLAEKCYGCHSSKMPAPKGSLVLDTREGLLKGGVSGPALVPGNPSESRLLKVLTYSDPLAQMPPSGKLPATVLADFEQWIARGAADPRASVAGSASAAAEYKGMSLEEGRKWWAFQPLSAHAVSRRSGGAAKADESDRLLHQREARAEEVADVPAGGQAHTRDASLRRSPRIQADLRRSSGVSERHSRRTRMRGSSTACSPRRTTVSDGRAGGWTWRATPKTIRRRRRRTRRIRSRGAIATGSSKR